MATVKIKFVIKSLLNDLYYDSNNQDLNKFDRATQYDTYDEAQIKIDNKVPDGVYQIDKIFVKEI